MDPLWTKGWCLRRRRRHHLRRHLHLHLRRYLRLHLRLRLRCFVYHPHYHWRYWHCSVFDFHHRWERKVWVREVYVWVPFEQWWLAVPLRVLFLVEPRSNRFAQEVSLLVQGCLEFRKP